MSQQDLTNQQGVYVQKPRSDVYTMLLFLSLVAMLVAIVCLYLEGDKYQWDIRAVDAPAVQPVSSLSIDHPYA